MTKETLQKAKELEKDINLIQKILDVAKDHKWIKIITPMENEHYHSVRFQRELAQWLEDKKQEYMQEFDCLGDKDSDCIIRHLTGECSYNETGCSGCNGRQKIHDALEKQSPQLPTLSGDGYYDGELVYDTWECPHCGTEYEIDYDDYDHCPKCGQKINKSEMEGKSDE